MCLMLAATVAEASMLQTIGAWVWPALGVAAGLTFVIFVHELGHFLVAKACGVKCEKFYVGFDFFEIPIPFTRWKIPRSLFKFQWGETEYGLGSLPLGGYVKMLGQDDDPRNAEAEAARTRVIQEGTASEGLVPGKTTEGKTVLLDPRSLPAKSVYARAAIFSAGVIMNLIFAVIMAAVAYGLGVRETPATIGSVNPGSPAWTAGIRPGSQILQFGKRGAPYENLRFDDLRTAVMLNGYDRDVDMLIRGPDSQPVWHAIRPSSRLKAQFKAPTIGISPLDSRLVRLETPPLEALNPAASPSLVDKDRVIEAEGQELKTDADLTAIMAQNPFGPLSIRVERKQAGEKSAAAPQVIAAVLPPRPMRDIGAVMKMGPVTAVRKGSPADEAGFLNGDQILEVNGEPVGDPLSLAQRLAAEAGKKSEPMTFVVSRQARDNAQAKRPLTVRPELPLQFSSRFPTGGPAGIECVGVAFDVLPIVESVAAGSPAEQAGLKPGDTITSVQFVPAGAAQREREKLLLSNDAFEPIVLDEQMKTWTLIFTLMQRVLPDTQVQLTWKSGAVNGDTAEKSAKLLPVDSTTFFDESRGLELYAQSRIHQAKGVGDALRLGFRETKERVREVLLILQSLVTRRLSATNLSGPAGIIFAAGSFASEGPAKLLIFLTILSANLAVLNFLPIPALDGGHMLFLAAEWIRGKPVDERLQIRLTIAGVLCLLTLMVFATAMDIGRFAEMIQQLF
jgi:regulator of sigma E protease